MPYSSSDGTFERASRLGHVSIAKSQVVKETLERWNIPAIEPRREDIEQRCLPIADVSQTEWPATRFLLSFDGSPQEVPAREEYPSVRVEYLQVAGVYVDIAAFLDSVDRGLVDPRRLAASKQASLINTVLPGSNVLGPDMTTVENWRYELFNTFRAQGVSDFSRHITLLDALFYLHGEPSKPAELITLGRCPYRHIDGCAARDIPIGPVEDKCPTCRRAIYPTDVLRTHEEFSEDGSNLTVITRVMNVVERLLSIAYVVGFSNELPRALSLAAFITDGPLAFFGTSAPLKRRFVSFWASLARDQASRGLSLPLLLGLEKTGIFVDHATAISQVVPRQHLVNLDNYYIRERIKRLPTGGEYGVDEFYGRRFFYKTQRDSMLVLTVPGVTAGQPYGEAGCENLDNYPTLGPTLRLLDTIETRLYPNAVIPIALAHSSASLPLGTGHNVLKILSREVLGIGKL